MVVLYKLERERNIYAFNEYYTWYYTDQRRLKKIQASKPTELLLDMVKKNKEQQKQPSLGGLAKLVK